MATWQSYMQITGAPLTADDAPNDTAPDASRVLTANSASLLVQLLDGTSATATVYAYNDTLATWEQVSTGAIGTTRPLVLAATPTKKTFVRLTSVVGSPTNCVVLDGSDLPDVLRALVTRASLNIDSATIHADVDEVEAKLDTLDTSVGNVETSVDETTAAVALVEAAVDATTTAVGSNTTAVDAVATAVGLVETAVAAVETDVEAVTTAVGLVKTAVDSATTAVGTLTNALKSATQAAAITPHDSNTFTATRAVLVGGAGTLVARFSGDGGNTTMAVLPGVYDISVILVHTSSKATGLVALY